MGQEKTVLALALETEAAAGLFDKPEIAHCFFVISKHDGPWDRSASVVAQYDTKEEALVEARRRKHLQPYRRFAVSALIAEAFITQSPITIVEEMNGKARNGVHHNGESL
jgi:hypothetical protein